MTCHSIAVMASGRGTNLEAILEASRSGRCPVDVHVVISNKMDAPALQIARDAGVPIVLFINPEDYCDRESYDLACSREIDKHQCQWVVLAGYMRILSPSFVSHFKNRLINIHPSLLPSFSGGKAVRDALQYGVKVSGCTVHLVNEEVDAGAILSQATVPVHDHDDERTLHQRIHMEEYKLYPDTLCRMVLFGFQLVGRKVIWND